MSLIHLRYNRVVVAEQPVASYVNDTLTNGTIVGNVYTGNSFSPYLEGENYIDLSAYNADSYEFEIEVLTMKGPDFNMGIRDPVDGNAERLIYVNSSYGRMFLNLTQVASSVGVVVSGDAFKVVVSATECKFYRNGTLFYTQVGTFGSGTHKIHCWPNGQTGLQLRVNYARYITLTL